MGPVGTEMKNVILDFKSKAGGRQEHKGEMETNIEHLLWGQIICHVMLPVTQWYYLLLAFPVKEVNAQKG